jgi:hypothetical protein
MSRPACVQRCSLRNVVRSQALPRKIGLNITSAMLTPTHRFALARGADIPNIAILQNAYDREADSGSAAHDANLQVVDALCNRRRSCPVCSSASSPSGTSAIPTRNCITILPKSPQRVPTGGSNPAYASADSLPKAARFFSGASPYGADRVSPAPTGTPASGLYKPHPSRTKARSRHLKASAQRALRPILNLGRPHLGSYQRCGMRLLIRHLLFPICDHARTRRQLRGRGVSHSTALVLNMR